MFAKTQYAVSAKPKVLSMVQNIRAALRDTILELDWMAPSTKAKAIEKLEAIQVFVGCPDHWRDMAGLVVSDDSYLHNVFRAREFEFQRRLDSVSKPTDRSLWSIAPYAVDARYSTSRNEIVLPAGLFQPPYFDIHADDASNYGSLGAVIGHEMMHGFDNQGRRFDADGNFNDWWSESDSNHFEERQQKLISQYDAYKMSDKQKVNGKLTLQENTADLGGLSVAYRAFKKSQTSEATALKDGYTPDQRFFIAFGQLFRAKYRPEAERLNLETNPHSPSQFRVNGVLQNMPQFWKAFNVPAPSTLLRIW